MTFFSDFFLYLSFSYSVLLPHVYCPFNQWIEGLGLTPAGSREPSDRHGIVTVTAIHRSNGDLCTATASTALSVRYVPGGYHSHWFQLAPLPLPSSLVPCKKKKKIKKMIVRVFTVYVFGNVKETRQLEIYARPPLSFFCSFFFICMCVCGCEYVRP